MILLLGPSGSGKSTQAKILSKRYPYLVWVSLGDLLRSNTSTHVQQLLDAGELIDDHLVVQIVGEAILKVSPQQTAVIDGFPRRLGQVKALEGMLPRLKRKIHLAIFINVSRATSEERLSRRRRSDDVLKIIERRWQWFEAETIPVINYFRDLDLLAEVNGEGTIEEVTKEIEKVLPDAG